MEENLRGPEHLRLPMLDVRYSLPNGEPRITVLAVSGLVTRMGQDGLLWRDKFPLIIRIRDIMGEIKVLVACQKNSNRQLGSRRGREPVP